MTYEEAWNRHKNFLQRVINDLKSKRILLAEDRTKIIILELLEKMQGDEDLIEE